MSREEIVQNVIDCGKYLAENADKIIPNVNNNVNIAIWCNVSKKDEARNIQVLCDYVPPYYGDC